MPWGRGRSGEHTAELPSHRDLHSFPPRRSSDLRVATGAAGAGSVGVHPLAGDATHRRYPRGCPGGGEGRESTRPNSRPTEIYTLSLHAALPILESRRARRERDLWGFILSLEMPLIAAIHGYALGAGKVGRAHGRTPVPPRSTLFPSTPLFRS